MWGVQGQALSQPGPLVRLGVRPGPTTHWLWVRGVRAREPVTNPTARALAHCAGDMTVPGGGASCLGLGRPGSGALPPRTTRPFGRAAGARFPLAVGAVCGRGGPAVLCSSDAHFHKTCGNLLICFKSGNLHAKKDDAQERVLAKRRKTKN